MRRRHRRTSSTITVLSLSLSTGHPPEFPDAYACCVAQVNRNINFVYGGVGLMGLISQRVYDGGCHVLGVIPKALVPIENSSVCGGAFVFSVESMKKEENLN
ncbi:hypothetical protein ACS0TY_006124 [Phlomoides rotata]